MVLPLQTGVARYATVYFHSLFPRKQNLIIQLNTSVSRLAVNAFCYQNKHLITLFSIVKLECLVTKNLVIFRQNILNQNFFLISKFFRSLIPQIEAIILQLKTIHSA